MNTSFIRKLTLLLAVTMSIGSYGILHAQLGENNPTGLTGEFNGNVTTGGSYDAYTGNAKRSITDIVVPGAVGTYPLAFTRTINTRTSYANYAWAAPFGRAGGWRHSYQWEVAPIQAHFDDCEAGGVPSEYTVIYPDGREVTFNANGASTTPGIGDRFQPIEDPHGETGSCALLLSDGGKVHFNATITRDCEKGSQDATFYFGWAGITDPYGQETTVVFTNWPPPAPYPFTTTITEPAGRNLTLCWIQYSAVGGIWVVARVEERLAPGAQVSRAVDYHYENFNNIPGNASLTSVDYFGDPTLTARYSYQASNEGPPNSPLIRTCDDSMYSGAMSKIAYDFAPGLAHGFLWRERYFNGTDPTTGPAVSTLTPPTDDETRVETRGDGPSRTFTYVGGLLKTWTDFQNHTSSQDHFTSGPTGFVSYVRDALGRQTDFLRNPIGKLTQIKPPWTPSDPIGARWTVIVGYDSGNPYHMTSLTNERQKTTTYTRDGNNRVENISYPDYHPNPPIYFTQEGFQYNDFGQVIRHQRKNGYYEHSNYDTRGLLLHRWNPTSISTPPAAPSVVTPRTSFTYYPLGHAWQDRIETVTDPRGKITRFEYDVTPAGQTRGLITKITYPGNKYVLFDYDRCGNKRWTENELRQRTTYEYDDYNRVRFVRTPLPVGVATTEFMYHPDIQDTPTPASPYLHTTQSVSTIVNPNGLVTRHRYDQNFRCIQTTQDAGSPDTSTTVYGYNEVGNRTSVTDPRVKVTTIVYDERNRRTEVVGPPMVNLGYLQYRTKWFYDPASNVRKVIQPDLTEIIFDYDEVNRPLWSEVTSADHQQDRRTEYTYWPSGQLKSLKDPKDQITEFEYNGRDLRKKMTYPNAQIVEGWSYDENGNMTERPTVGGPRQFFTYDDRNRLEHMRWSNGIDFSDFGYDDAGRLTSAINFNSAITRQYDEGGRLKLDRQVLTATFNTPEITIEPIEVVSRKAHGSAGSFDISLPLTGAPGIECRNGPEHSLVLTFANPVTMGGATVSSGIGHVTSASANGNVVAVHLSDVSNAQVITVRVFGLSDGVSAGELTIPIHVLNGDTNGDGVVNSEDGQLTDSNSGYETDASNFRSDVNVDGVINGDDVIKVTTTAGTGEVPASPGVFQADVSYTYRADGRRETLFVPSIPDYNFTYTYDGLGRLESIFRTNFTNEHYQYAYDRSSNITARYTNETSISYGRDEVNRITDETMFLGIYPFLNFQYGYDRMNRLLTRDQYGALRDRFGYDFTGELKSAEYGLHPDGPDGFINPERTVNYLYDRAGNRQSVNTSPYVVNNSLNQYNSVGGSPVDNGSQHELSSYNGVHYSYLADTRLASVGSNSGEVPANYYQLGYDALGRTVRRTINGEKTYFIYDGAHSILELNGSGTMTSSTLYGLQADEILKRNNNGAEQFFMQDRQNSTLLVTGPKGDVLEQYRYDAFGTPEIFDPQGGPLEESQINNRFLFTGREWVPRFGFYEYRARAYHPGLGRFMSEDPLGFAGGDANLFRYCGNDPVNFYDDSGLRGLPIGPIRPPGGGSGGRGGVPNWPNTRGSLDRGQIRNTMQEFGPMQNYNANLIEDILRSWGIRRGEGLQQFFPSRPYKGDVNAGGPNINMGLLILVGSESPMPNASGPIHTVPSLQVGIGEAILALSAYTLAHGPGIGQISVNGRVIARGNFGGSFSFNGTTYFGGVPIRGLGSPLISTGGGGFGGWAEINPGWASFPGPEAGEGFHPPGEP